MTGNLPPLRQRLARQLRAFACALLCANVLATAQTPPPNSVPGSPVLLTEGTGQTTRAVAYESVTHASEPFKVTSEFAWSKDARTRVTVFVMGLDLFAGEGANALTADAVDASGKTYPLKVESLSRPVYLQLGPAPGNPALLIPFEVPQHWLHAVTLRLHDEMTDSLGDVTVSVNFRGLRSNRARIALGQTGGGPPVDATVEYVAAAPATPPAPTPTPTPKAFGPNESNDADVVRLLEQASWGPTEAEVARVKSIGLRAYVNEQFETPPQHPEVGSNYPTMTFVVDGIGSPGCPPDGLSTNPPGYSRAVCARENYVSYPVQTRFFRLAVGGQDQLRQRVAFALHQIITVSALGIKIPSYYTPYLQALDRNAFGNYRTLLREVTLTPAMGEYLDMRTSTRANPNENFAREILQLFSIGVDELNPDGTPKLDATGAPVQSYTQATVENFTRAFTGWDLDPNIIAPGVFNWRDPMVPRVGAAVTHDTGPKTLLNGVTIPACPEGMTSQDCARRDLDAALDNIFNHPNVGPFVSKQLIQHLVTSNPSPAYVERVARAFNNDCAALYAEGCANVRGEMKAVVRAVLLDPEARGDLKTDPRYGRLREPLQYINNILRLGNAKSFDKTSTTDGVLSAFTVAPDFATPMDQPVYRPVSVFGYFTPDYVIPGTSVVGPPFGILTTTTTLSRANYANTMIHTGVAPNSTPSVSPSRPRGTSLDLSPYEALAADPQQLVSALDRLLLHGTMPAQMRASIIAAVGTIQPSEAQSARKRVQMALYIVATSPQYDIQR